MIKDLKVMIGDDSILARKQVKDILKALEITEIYEAVNGQDVIDKYKEYQPDIVFLDIVMPVKDGTEAISEIISEYPKAEIIVVSSVGTQTMLKKAIENGAKDFVQKPINPDKIKEILLARFERI